MKKCCCTLISYSSTQNPSLPDKQSTDCGRQQRDQQSGQHHVYDVARDDHIALRVNQPLEAAEDDANRPEVGE